MSRHPEQRDDEIYMGNFVKREVRGERIRKHTGWWTERWGAWPMGRDGYPLPDEGTHPVFIKRGEVEEKVKELRATSSGPLDQWTAGCLSDLLETGDITEVPPRPFNWPRSRP